MKIKALDWLSTWFPWKRSDSLTGTPQTELENKEATERPNPSSLLKYLTPFNGVSSLSVLLGVFFTIFVLTKFVSPIIGKLALEPIVTPLAAFGLLLVGQFEAVKLQQMLLENAGVIASTLGVVMALLFVQNCMKSTLLIQSIRRSHRDYMMHAVAGLLTPITTSSLWALAVHLGYFPLSMKSVGVAVLAIFAGPTIASIPVDSIANLGEIAKQARFPILFILLCHLSLIVLTYKWIYRGIEGVLNRVWKKEWVIWKLPDGLLKNKVTIVLEEYQKTPFLADLVVLIALAFTVSYFQVIPWYVAGAIASSVALILSEYKRFWCEDDTEGGIFDLQRDHTITSFTEEEARHRRITRYIMVGFSVVSISLVFLLGGNQHPTLAGICAASFVVGNICLLHRNKKIFKSAIKDGRTES